MSRNFDLKLSFSGLIVLLGITLALFCTGCSHVFNPYHSHFQCPETYKGKCVSVQTAYQESIEGKDEEKAKCKECQKGKKKAETEKAVSKEESDPLLLQTVQKVYEKELFQKYAKLIKDPTAPLVVPPDVGRVLILSYTGNDNILYSWRYVYFFLNKPRWILISPVEGK